MWYFCLAWLLLLAAIWISCVVHCTHVRVPLVVSCGLMPVGCSFFASHARVAAPVWLLESFFLLHSGQIVWYSYCHVDSFVVVTCVLFLVVSCVDTLVLAGKSSANDFVSLRLFHAVSILTRSVIRPISTVITVVAGCRYYWILFIPYHDDPIGIQCQCCVLFWSRAHALWLVGFS